MVIVSALLSWSELGRWWRGAENHTFAVEKGISRTMQINLDIVVRMKCADIHVNAQDAAGDRILAAEMLQRDPHQLAAVGRPQGRAPPRPRLAGPPGHRRGLDVAGPRGGLRRGAHPRHRRARPQARALGQDPALWGSDGDSCRIYGSLDLNKVQGDFHITARGHGYMEFGEHLDHSGRSPPPPCPLLISVPPSPSDWLSVCLQPSTSRTSSRSSRSGPSTRPGQPARRHGQRRAGPLPPLPVLHVGRAHRLQRRPRRLVGSRAIFTNQYAVTEQSAEINERNIPGIFFKYDIEPILLNIEEYRDGFLVFLIKIVNVVSGVLVTAHWGFTLSEWIREVMSRRRRTSTNGMLGNKDHYAD